MTRRQGTHIFHGSRVYRQTQDNRTFNKPKKTKKNPIDRPSAPFDWLNCKNNAAVKVTSTKLLAVFSLEA